MASRTGDRHAKAQLNVRIPPDLLTRLKDGAERHGQTITDISVRGITLELDRLDGLADPPPPPPPPVAALEDPPQQARNCKHRNMRMSKGVCPDCQEWVTKEVKR